MKKNHFSLVRHRVIGGLIVIVFSMFTAYLFFPIQGVGFYKWILISLQMMCGILVFTFYGFVEGYIDQVIDIVVVGLGVPLLFFAIHIWKKSLVALYAGIFFWMLAGWASVIAGRI